QSTNKKSIHLEQEANLSNFQGILNVGGDISGKIAVGIKTSRMKEQEAIKKVRQEQKKHREADLWLQAGIKVPPQNFPVVHCNLAEVPFYQGGAVPKQETYVPSTDDISHERSIDFDDLVKSDKRFTGVIGNPGAGKSTLSKRLAKTEEYTTFHIKFSDLPGKRELTLREMLIDNSYLNLDDDTCKHSFEWVKNNQNQCLIIFDGLELGL
ncbi:unnamed protein product, partial [Clavelina lepadiformis]